MKHEPIRNADDRAAMLRAMRTVANHYDNAGDFMVWVVGCMANGSDMAGLFIDLLGSKIGRDYPTVFKELHAQSL